MLGLGWLKLTGLAVIGLALAASMTTFFIQKATIATQKAEIATLNANIDKLELAVQSKDQLILRRQQELADAVRERAELARADAAEEERIAKLRQEMEEMQVALTNLRRSNPSQLATAITERWKCLTIFFETPERCDSIIAPSINSSPIPVIPPIP